MKRRENSRFDQSLRNMKDNEIVNQERQEKIQEGIHSAINRRATQPQRTGKGPFWLKRLLPVFAVLLVVAISGTLYLNQTGGNDPAGPSDNPDRSDEVDREKDQLDDDSNDEDENDHDATDHGDTGTDEDNASDPEPGLYDPEEVVESKPEDTPGEDRVHPKAQKNLELPYIYENTVVYGGTINPVQLIRFEIPIEGEEDTRTIDPVITYDGRFRIPLEDADLEAGDELLMYISRNMNHEQQFKLPVHPKEEGMEIVPEKSETTQEIEEATELPDLFDNTTTYEGKTIPDANVQATEMKTGDTIGTVTGENGDFAINFSDFPDSSNSLYSGDTLFFIFTDEDGYSAYAEKEVLAADTNTENGNDDSEQRGDISEDEAIENVVDHVDETTDVDRDDIVTMPQDGEEGKYLIQAFVLAPSDDDDEPQMTNTIGWYLVDKQTGEVEEKGY